MKSIVIVDSTSFIHEKTLSIINSVECDFLFIKKNKYIIKNIYGLPNARVINVTNDYVEILNHSRDNIINFFANLPQRLFENSNGKYESFYSLFNYENIPAWHFMGFSNKASEGGEFVNRLFQLDVINFYLDKNKYDFGLVITENSSFESCVKDLFLKHKISCNRQAISPVSKMHSFGLIFFKRCLILAKLITVKFFTIFYMFFVKKGKKNKIDSETLSNVCFHSWYPAHWITINELDYCDKYFTDLIYYINKNSIKIKSFYLFKLMFYERSIIKNFINLINIAKIGNEFDFIERYIPIAEMAKMLLDPFEIKKYIDLECNYNYTKNFDYNGINVFYLAQTEFRTSFFYNFPYHVAVMKATIIFLKFNPYFKIYLTFLELYSYSRGIYKKLSKFSNMKTIAFQHSTITKYNLNYNFNVSEVDALNKFKLPLPDFFILSGKVPGNTLQNFGVPENSIKISGSPRYEFINQYIDKKSSIIKSRQNKTVLLATVCEREDTMQLVKLVLDAINGQPKIDLIIKTHPMCNIKNEIKTCISKDYKNICYEFNDDYIYETIIKVDLFITSNSMAGLEALILGTDVVLYGDPFKINISPLAESLEFKDKICYSDDEFVDAIKKAIDKKAEPPDPQKIKRLISNFYYKLDGRANERILKILEDIIDGKI